MRLAPIVLFVYDRLRHVQNTVKALVKNEFSCDSELIIFSDAAKCEKSIEAVDDVRRYINKIEGFKSVAVVERSHNLGLANSIIGGVTSVLSEYDRIIVLEDDMVTSPYFLKYMNDALDRFVDEERVVSVHGWCFPTQKNLPEAFFLLGADCWGWSTWRRGWELFNPNGQELLDEIDVRGLRRFFDLDGAYCYTKMLEDQIRGLNDSWAIRWHASAFLSGKLTLHPGRSLVHNIGNDKSGTHCAKTDQLDVELSSVPIDLQNVSVELSAVGLEAQKCFYRQTRCSVIGRIMRRINSAVFKDVM